MYRPSELRQFLDRLSIFPKKGLSQNFLIDGNIIRKIVSASGVCSGDIVLEIGPGPGSLTQALLDIGARVLAVEKDTLLAKELERFQTADQRLHVYNQDILKFPFVQEISPWLKNGQKVKLIANLPYHLTTPILIQCVSQYELFSSITVMVQDEFAKRCTAKVGSSDYSSLTIFLHFYSNPHYAFPVSKQCFYPVPKVNSAVVVLQLKAPPLNVENAKTFFQITRTAFEHRRKMLRASLKDLFSPQDIEKALVTIGKNPLSRPESLSLDEFIQFHALLCHESRIFGNPE